MQIQVQARHGSLADATRQKIADKVEKLGRFIERVSSIDVMVDLEKADQPVVEVVVATELKKDFRADYSSGDLWGCLDQTIDKIEQQMRKFKEKMTDHR
ncbi:MAG: ribosome-associated translation inhibitor RaiA [Thermoguttaceae bacterium]|nr:ribosome-associated translation inhibitor RaiA [Thermoguttaceae bacterium]MBQ6827930.1 ribosome-associated translation inhibitor RaiA [Thermoguttaceae bacterium]MBQ8287110.1 ribosome-associated translation inhibitor RaiA [Thermoguttaceae bacterium]MBQ8363900.1 ribosome-associated translation inhibitor RaiA [Thermoguttaceae bacterium]